MNQRNVVIGAVTAVVIVGGGAWFLFGGSGGGASAARAGAGPYQTELMECQDRVWGDAMHIAELEFTPGTVWHEPGEPTAKIGGKFTKPDARSPKSSYTYECTVRSGRVIASAIK